MAQRPAVLVLDDGELSNVCRMLRKLGADVDRLQGKEIGRSVTAPRDLLISAGRRTLGDMPDLIAPKGTVDPPTWVCIHNQDFLPMRQRLAEMGVHYLVQNALDEDSLQRFLLQILRSGSEQRRRARLPLGGQVGYRTDAAKKSAKLVDLSSEGCRILAPEALDAGKSLSLILPASLGGGNELELTGAVLRGAEPEIRGGHEVFSTVVRFEGLDEAARQQLEAIARGASIGTKITPLREPASSSVAEPVAHSVAEPVVHWIAEPSEEDSPEPLPLDEPRAEVATLEAEPDRREVARHAYDRQVQVLGHEPPGKDPALGCSLSLSGVRLIGCPGLVAGTRVTVALYGAPREEPVVLEAKVHRTGENGDAALVFEPLPPDGRRQLEKLLSTRPLLDSLLEPDPDSGRTVVAEVEHSATA